MYQEIWEQLVQKKMCKLTAPKAYHARIIKAVVKEKYRDSSYREWCAMNQVTSQLQSRVTGDIITFTVVYKGVGIL
jgi:hypothetical protein